MININNLDVHQKKNLVMNILKKYDGDFKHDIDTIDKLLSSHKYEMDLIYDEATDIRKIYAEINQLLKNDVHLENIVRDEENQNLSDKLTHFDKDKHEFIRKLKEFDSINKRILVELDSLREKKSKLVHDFSEHANTILNLLKSYFNANGVLEKINIIDIIHDKEKYYYDVDKEIIEHNKKYNERMESLTDGLKKSLKRSKKLIRKILNIESDEEDQMDDVQNELKEIA